ncbi:hypothetical protein [Parasphingorhabdus pacifica]
MNDRDPRSEEDSRTEPLELTNPIVVAACEGWNDGITRTGGLQ